MSEESKQTHKSDAQEITQSEAVEVESQNPLKEEKLQEESKEKEGEEQESNEQVKEPLELPQMVAKESMVASIPKGKKHQEAQALIEESKRIVAECQEQSEACQMLLESDLNAYKEAERSLRHHGVQESRLLLEELGYHDFVSQRTREESELLFSTPKGEEGYVVERIHTGRFTGVLYGVLGVLLFVVVVLYSAIGSLGVSFEAGVFLSQSFWRDTLSWFALLFGMEGSFLYGSLLFGAMVVVIFVAIYGVRVYLKTKSNLLFAQQQLQEVKAYQERQGQCKWEMGQVELHMRETLETMKLYEVLLQEQKMKLRRILHIEGVKSKESEYHEKSRIEIGDTKVLIEMIEDFMSIPLSEEGRLSEKSVIYLEQSKITINKILSRFYG
jgi:ABC-type multidrug transport system fused ATPase/permease subunit